MRTILVTVVACLLLVGCTTEQAPGGPGGPEQRLLVDVPASDPVGLVGLWRVSDAEGEGARTWLRLTGGSYQLWRDCGGYVEGGWRASSRVLAAAQPFSASDGCPVDPWPSVPWLAGARAYRPVDGGWELLDASGDVLARLTVDGAPDPIGSAPAEYAQPPEVTDEVRASFAEPGPLPDGLEPASADALTGRWEPVGRGATGAFVELSADGTWTGSDGCNGAGGAWGLDEGGWLLATSGITTLIGCDGAAVPSWLASAARAGLDGEVLVLVDAEGAELGRLVRG